MHACAAASPSHCNSGLQMVLLQSTQASYICVLDIALHRHLHCIAEQAMSTLYTHLISFWGLLGCIEDSMPDCSHPQLCNRHLCIGILLTCGHNISVHHPHSSDITLLCISPGCCSTACKLFCTPQHPQCMVPSPSVLCSPASSSFDGIGTSTTILVRRC